MKPARTFEIYRWDDGWSVARVFPETLRSIEASLMDRPAWPKWSEPAKLISWDPDHLYFLLKAPNGEVEAFLSAHLTSPGMPVRLVLDEAYGPGLGWVPPDARGRLIAFIVDMVPDPEQWGISGLAGDPLRLPRFIRDEQWRRARTTTRSPWWRGWSTGKYTGHTEQMAMARQRIVHSNISGETIFSNLVAWNESGAEFFNLDTGTRSLLYFRGLKGIVTLLLSYELRHHASPIWRIWAATWPKGELPPWEKHHVTAAGTQPDDWLSKSNRGFDKVHLTLLGISDMGPLEARYDARLVVPLSEQKQRHVELAGPPGTWVVDPELYELLNEDNPVLWPEAEFLELWNDFNPGEPS